MDSSEQIEKVSAALVGAFGDLHNVAADAVNPHFRSRYTSLPALLDTVRPVLSKHGLALVQMPVSDGAQVGVRSVLLHTSGQYLASVVTVRPQKDDPQGAGSAITYCRRYALAACFGIGQDDDDGNAASKKPAAAKPAEPQRAPAQPAAQQAQRPANGARCITEAQGKRLWAIAAKRASELESVGREEIVRDVLRRFAIEHTEQIPMVSYDAIIRDVQGWEVPVCGDEPPLPGDEEAF